MSRDALAAKAGLSPSTTYRAEKDNPKTEWESYAALAKALDLEIDWTNLRILIPPHLTEEELIAYAGKAKSDDAEILALVKELAKQRKADPIAMLKALLVSGRPHQSRSPRHQSRKIRAR